MVTFIHSFIHYFPVGCQPEHRAPFVVSAITHAIRHMVGLLWTSDQPVAEASTYTRQHINTRDKHPCPEQDSNPRSQPPRAVDLHLRLRGHWDRLMITLVTSNYLNRLHPKKVQYSYIMTSTQQSGHTIVVVDENNDKF
jgi:hypothetical protein